MEWFLNLHPLVSCDKETIQEFTENLAFKDGALAEAKYDVLTDKLPPDQIKTLFQFFGIDDYQEKINYRCDNCGGEATCCTPAVGYICTDHCWFKDVEELFFF